MEKFNFQLRQLFRRSSVALTFVFTFSLLLSISSERQAHAATDVATLPIFSTIKPAVEVKPNLMFILDDSGSMDWDYMPDAAGNFDCGGNNCSTLKYGFASSQCNGVYYNPAITYKPPVNSAGLSYLDASFTAAPKDGHGLTTGTTDLSSSFKAHAGDSSQAAYYYTYSGKQTTDRQKDYNSTSSIFYKECNSAIGSNTAHDGVSAVSSLFHKVIVSSTSSPKGADERTNFANWYSYYRTRMNMMKTSAGLAFSSDSLAGKFRVGFMTLNNNTTDSFLNIDDFTGAQKTSFYTSLYNSKPNNGTPLRAALSAAGRMYAGKLTSYKSENNTTRTFTVTDPVQYACQQNYTLLSTDGYWNGGAGVQLDGTTTVGNQDGNLPRPYNDGTSNTTTTVTSYDSTQNWKTDHTIGTITKTWTKMTTTHGGSCTAQYAPANLGTAYMNVGNSRTGALGKQSATPSGTCYSLGNQAWFCRGGSNSSPSVNLSNATDTAGKTWYLVTNVAGKTGCVTSFAAFGNNYSSTSGVCPTQSGAGTYVSVTPYRQTQVLTAYAETQEDLYTATQTITQTTVDGQAGSPGAMSPSTPAYVFTSNTTPLSSTVGGETCGGQAAPCPSAAGTWIAGTPTTNNVCTVNTALPAAGSTTPVITGTVNTGENTTVTVTQLTTQVARAPQVTAVTTAAGVADTLADVSAYYYATNLRTSTLGNCTGPTIAPATTPNDLCLENKVPSTAVDTAKWQHMTTFTLGLGVRGRMVFNADYLTNTTDDSDYLYVAKGTTTGNSTYCTWRDTLTTSSSKCNWPIPSADSTATTDDLWHTAVNGRGNYFSASDPLGLAAGLANTLETIANAPKPGTASASATTSPRVTKTNNFQFSSYFKTTEWSGELIRQTMDLKTGAVPTYNHAAPSSAAYDWSAQTKLDEKAQTHTDRKIYTRNSSGLMEFTWANLGAAGLQSNFTAPHISTAPPQYHVALTGLTQFCATGTNCLTSAAQSNTTVATSGAAGEALVNFLRGDRTNEGALADTSKYYRQRTHVLGDIVSAQPLYLGAPSRYYADSGYADFKTKWASRKALVYTAANDGMLHAFNAQDGSEEWAYIPSFVLPRLYALADKNYGEKHQYSVEGTPVYADICPKAPALTCDKDEWKTILVGGLNGGGTGYYALDVTDPAAPSLLWEFTDNNMGYSFGRPQITKLDDGSWVVMFTSGYNNCPWSNTAVQKTCVKNGSGDGQGYLYVLNAADGVQKTGSPISTGVGVYDDPSGLSQITAQVDANNITKRVYSGDLFGNLWRFNVETGKFGKHLLATVKDSTGAVQPITVRPIVTTINSYPVVYFGTGRYLGITDVGGKPRNSFYAITDDLTATLYYNNPRTYPTFIGQTTSTDVCPSGVDVSICQPNTEVRIAKQTAGAAGDSLANMNGWYLDFPANAGEIQFTDPKLTLGTLTFSTSIPVESTAETCTKANAGEGSSFDYMLNFLTGGAVGTTSGVVGTYLGSGVATAPQITQLPDGTVIAKYRLSDGREVTRILRFGTGSGGTKRISWRELVTE